MKYKRRATTKMSEKKSIDVSSSIIQNKEFVVRTESRLTKVETELQHLATKEDIAKLPISILKWLAPTIIAAIGVTATIISVIIKLIWK